MLLNLIKYDLKFILKTVLIYSILLLASAILHNLTSYDYTPTFFNEADQLVGGEPDAPVIIQFLHTVFYNAVIAMLIALTLNAIIRIWARFKLSVYGDEAYLTHTLPISRNSLWLSKFLSAIITIIIVISVTTLTCAILSLTTTGKSLISTFGVIETTNFIFYPVYIFAIFSELLIMTTCGLSGIIIGYRTNNNRGLRAIISGFIIYIFSALLLLGFIALWGVFDSTIQQGIFGSINNPHEFYNIDFIIKVIFGISLTYTAITTALYFLNRKLLQHGINLD